MADEDTAAEVDAVQAPADVAPEIDEAEEEAPRVAEPFIDPTVEVRFTRRTPWCVGTAEGASEHVFETDEVVELPSSVAHVFVGIGAAAWSGDTETAVLKAGEVATRSRRRRK
jgi:hypothetical protein